MLGDRVCGDTEGDVVGDNVWPGMVGERVTGARVGSADGDGAVVGSLVREGEDVGVIAGETGENEGDSVGFWLGDKVWPGVVGDRVTGARVGNADDEGAVVGCLVCDGANVGVSAGDTGEDDGDSVGLGLGDKVWPGTDGERVRGAAVGKLVGDAVGSSVGGNVSPGVVGERVIGETVGSFEGDTVGSCVGEEV